MTRIRKVWLSGALVPAVFACSAPTAGRLAPLPEPAIVAESASVTIVAPGVKHRYYWMARGPWAVHVLDVDRSACWRPIAVNGRSEANGRTRTSELYRYESLFVRDIPDGMLAGAVNADFFSLATGVPVGAFVHFGTVFAGPVSRPAFGTDTAGAPFIAPLSLTASVTHRERATPVRWNRPLVADISLVDERWAARTDTVTGAVEITLRRIAREPDLGIRALTYRGDYGYIAVVEAVDTSVSGVQLPRGGWVIAIGARADSTRRAELLALAVGDTVRLTRTFTGVRPREAVGGYPMLLRSGAVASTVDSAGSVSFRNRNPRTAVGLASGGRRMLFVTVDGRQMPYSDGMTLRELADLMRTLGAQDALNLDGGGSTTMVVRDSTAQPGFHIANRPSDKEGERPVGNAILIVRQCDTAAADTVRRP